MGNNHSFGMATDIQPLHGSMHAHTKKRHRDDEGNQQLWYRSDEAEQQVHAQNYAFMLHNLMVVIQDYLLPSDDDNRCGARSSLELVDSTARLREDNRICIWLQEVASEPKPNRMKHCTQ